MTNAERFIEAYDKWADAIFRFAYFRVYNRESAKELMQEAFCRAWQYVVDGKEIDNLRALLYQIARNLIIDQSRKKQAVSLDQMKEKGFEPSNILDNIEKSLDHEMEWRATMAGLGRLEPEYREAVELRYVAGLRPREIAKITGQNVNVVSVRINRGVQKIKQYLAEDKK